MRGSQFAELQAFAHVAEKRSFTQAALMMGVSPSALSQIIRGLEDRMGIRLLNRTTRSVAPTEAGEWLLERIVPLMEQFDDVLSKATNLREMVGGKLRLCAPQIVVAQVVQPIVTIFQRSNPDVSVEIVCCETPVDLVKEGVDIAFGMRQFVDRDMIAISAGPTLSRIAVASLSYIQKNGTPAHPADLANHRLNTWRQAGQQKPDNWCFTNGEAVEDIAVSGALAVNDCGVALASALDGLGVTVWTREWMEPHIDRRLLVPLLQDWTLPKLEICAYYPRQRHATAAQRAFIEAVRTFGAEGCHPLQDTRSYASVPRRLVGVK